MSLYREFSEHEYCAGWFGGVHANADTQEEFKAWLKRHLAKIPSDLTDYERAALPTLRRIYEEACREC